MAWNQARVRGQSTQLQKVSWRNIALPGELELLKDTFHMRMQKEESFEEFLVHLKITDQSSYLWCFQRFHFKGSDCDWHQRSIDTEKIPGRKDIKTKQTNKNLFSQARKIIRDNMEILQGKQGHAVCQERKLGEFWRDSPELSARTSQSEIHDNSQVHIMPRSLGTLQQL